MAILEKKGGETRCSNCGVANRSTLTNCWSCGGTFEKTVEVENYSEPAKTVITNKSIQADNSEVKPVIIKDIKMDFGSMVTFMVKWVIASIPAMIILYLIGIVIVGLFAGFGLLIM